MTPNEPSLDDLIRAHREGVGLSDGQRALNRVRLLSRASLGSAVTAASVSRGASLAARLSSGTAGAWTVRVALGVLLAGGVGAGYFVVRPAATTSNAATTRGVVTAPPARPEPSASQPAISAGNALSPEVRLPEATAAKTPQPGTAASTSAAPSAAPVARAVPGRALAPHSSLAEEVQLMHDVDAALRAGRPQLALSLLEAPRARDGGFLGEERAAAYVVTLCQLGRADAARREAQRFLRARPHSPLAARMRATCAPPTTLPAPEKDK